MIRKLKDFPWGYLLFALLLGGTGACFLAFSENELLPTAILIVGILLTVFSILYGVLSLSKKDRSVRFFLRMVYTGLALIGGIVTIVFNDAAVETVVALVGLLLVVDGSFKLQTAIHLKRYHSFFWWLMVVCAVLPILGGFFLSKYYGAAAESDQTLSILLGLTVVIDALGNLLTAFAQPYIEKSVRNDVLQADTLPEKKDSQS
ncbi:MAG: DUF308 domain-containing protein [Clostridia bacterium]|nr:DUF308 domain-containing protein [Clostridia bacterium]